MTALKTLIKENASLIRELKYNVKEKQGVIEMLTEQLFREEEKVPELVEACQDLHQHPGMQESYDIGDFHCIIDKQTFIEIQRVLVKVEGKEIVDDN